MKRATIYILSLLLVQALSADVCINYTDLSSAVCQTAAFNDQQRLGSWSTRIVDNGPESMTSRHTVHRDTLELDARTGYQLHTTLPNGKPSVRLGNWDINKQAERITYTYTVPDDNPVLILYYAVVLEDPGHDEADQPRFTMELLKNGVPAASDCFAFDFRAGYGMDSASWHLEMPGICWKDWTMMGVSLADYAGQTIQLQFTTYDCNKGEHYGYAYFGLECRSNKMETTSCGDYTDDDAATFIAPDGFNYCWYLPSNPEDTLSTEQVFYHTGPQTTYYCNIINKENADCYFTLQATPEARYPIAEFTYEQHRLGCADTILLTNLSGVSEDGINKKTPLEPCDNYLWDFGDGRTSTEAQPLLTYSSPGTYTITLTAGLQDWQCASAEYTQTVVVEAREEAQRVERTICEGERYMWQGHTYTAQGEYADPLGNGLCDDILSLTVHPAGKHYTYDTICHGDSYLWRGAELTAAGVYTDTAYNKTVEGCDSVYYLNLTYYTRYDRVPQELEDRLSPTQVNNRRDVSYYSSNAEEWDDPYLLVSIDHQTADGNSFDWHGKTYTQSGVYADTLTTIHGCDSVVFLDLVLTAVPLMTVIPESDSFCEGDSYEWVGHGERFADLKTANEYRDTIIDAGTLDTTLYILTLTEKKKSEAEINITICDKQIPYEWNGISCDKADNYVYSTVNAAGCDSTVTLHLQVNTYSATDTTAAICESELPYLWHGKTLTAEGQAKDTMSNSVGCDSIVTLTLTINKPTADEVSHTVCIEDLPYIWNGISCDKADDYVYLTLNAAGCDSTVTLHLTTQQCTEECVTVYGDTTATICEAELPYQWRGQTLTQAGQTTVTLKNYRDCDSIVTLTLKVNRPSFAQLSYEACIEDLPYMWNGIECYEARDYTYVTTNYLGCDSTVTLHFTTRRCQQHESDLYVQMTIDTVCADDRYLPLEVKVLSGKVTSFSAVFSEQARDQGFEDVPSSPFTGQINIPMPYDWLDSTDYVRPDDYSLTITLTDTAGVTNTYSLSFTVLYPSWIVLQRWNDVLALLNDRYNGGYTFSRIRWFREGQEVEGRGEHNSYIYTLPNLSFGDAYWALLTRADDGKTLRTCYLYPDYTDNDKTQVNFGPVRLVRREKTQTFGIITKQNGKYYVYDISGKMLQKGVYGDKYMSPDLEIRTTLKGCYIVLFEAEEGGLETQKIIID